MTFSGTEGAVAQTAMTKPSTPASPAGEDATLLRLSGVTRVFGREIAVNRIDLEIRRGEVFALLGPSGCGKSTTLRMIAGLEPLDEGSITMDGRLLADARRRWSLPPERRDLGIVFQSYAVWPHMTVAENVAFPLKMRRIPRSQRQERVDKVLQLTGLDLLADKPATQLSGGQQQRVALARALVYEPKLLLLDEPLSNLDARLRVQMRSEIRRLNQELNVTMLFVTHDQSEAFSVADRMGVMAAGRLEQVGTPAEMYESPGTPYVRDFLGRSLSIQGVLRWSGAAATIHLPRAAGEGAHVGPISRPDLARLDGEPVRIFFRPEDVEILPGRSDHVKPNQLIATIGAAEYLGDHYEYRVDVDGPVGVLDAPRRSPYRVNDTVTLQLDPGRVSVWPL